MSYGQALPAFVQGYLLLQRMFAERTAFADRMFPFKSVIVVQHGKDGISPGQRQQVYYHKKFSFLKLRGPLLEFHAGGTRPS